MGRIFGQVHLLPGQVCDHQISLLFVDVVIIIITMVIIIITMVISIITMVNGHDHAAQIRLCAAALRCEEWES